MSDALIQIETPHGRFWTRENDFVNAQLRDRGGHQRSELGMLLSLVRPGDVVLDIGAHIGTFSIPLGRAVGEAGTVHSFEPVPESLAILEKNVVENGLEGRVVATNTIVTDQPGSYSVTLSDDHTSAAHFSLESASSTGGGGTRAEVSTTSLDEWGAALERLDVMKIDTEGMELRVLRSARALIEHHRPIIMAEMSGEFLSRQGDSVKAVGRFLRPFGYHFFRNLGPRHAVDEAFELARVIDPKHVTDLYDLVAIHPDSDRYPAKARSGVPSLVKWTIARIRSLPGGVRRRLLGS